MAVTENNYTGNGSTTSFNISFPFLRESDVKVTIDEVLQSSGYSHDSSTNTIIFTSAPAVGEAIRIFRDTDVDTLAATFYAGSAFRAKDLNDDFKQHNYRAQEVENNTWDKSSETIHSTETWASNDTQIATTAAMDARFQDEATETITSSETWPSNNDTVATTAAIDGRIDTAITNDISSSDGLTITDNGDGTINIGIPSGNIDLDRIKPSDIITQAEQNEGSGVSDGTIFTASAAATRFDNLVQTGTPTGSDHQIGKIWLQDNVDKTLSIWNGSNWIGVVSGGTFQNQPKVVYVDSSSGSDTNDGHRISRPKRSIKAAINDINADTNGDGCIVVVAPGVYQEAGPISINKNDVSIIGQSVRSVVVHPTQATEKSILFELNSGSYISSLTIMGMKASGTRGAAVSDDSLPDNPDGAVFGQSPTADQTKYGLPPEQGWNFAFKSGATIRKSPYVHNVVNFSDSEIDNTADPFPAFLPAGGSAGDIDHDPCGGGMLIDGSVVDSDSPLRSMVADSYTHTALDGPGIFVTNNGYAQLTSSYAFFCHFHIKCLNGGQANLAASTSDFGRFGLIAQGRSTSAIFTSSVSGNPADGATTFTINAPSAGSDWFGNTMRPADNMVVDVNGHTYPVRSCVANGSGWDVTIWRSSSTNYGTNLGLNGAVSDGTSVSFFLRSMIASSGHTMEYVGSGCDYRALPYNATGTYTVGSGTSDCGVPVEAQEVTEIGDGKIWTAITNHQGTFRVGGATTSAGSQDPWLRVDQTTGAVQIRQGSYSADIITDTSPQLGAPLDVLTHKIYTTHGTNTNISIEPKGTGSVDVNSSKIINVTNPTGDQDAATKKYVDDNFVADVGGTMSGDLAMSTNKVTGVGDPTNNQDAATKKYVDDNAGETNVPTNLSYTAASRVLASSTGTDVTLPEATSSAAGLLSGADKTKLNGIAENANNYTHPTHDGDDIDLDTNPLTGAKVISDLDFNITTDGFGHVTDANATVSTRDLTLANLGYSGASDANNYSHPNHGVSGNGDATSNGDGDITIKDDAVTYAKMQNLAVGNRVLGGTAAGDIAEVQVTTDMISFAASSADGVRKITTSTSDPSGGNDGDIWIKYTA